MMKHSFRRTASVVLICFPMLIVSCQTARMALPGFLEERTEAYACVGRQGFRFGEDFSFGPYQVHEVRRGWMQRVEWDLAFAEGSARRQEFEYMLHAPDGNRWQGHAVTGVRKQDVSGRVGGGEWRWDLAADMNFLVHIEDERQEQFWTLAMAEGRGDTVMHGELSDGHQVYRVEGTHRLAGTTMPLLDPAGFIIYKDRRAVAAVEVINQGMVYVDRDLDSIERDVLAVAATALLLYRDISGR